MQGLLKTANGFLPIVLLVRREDVMETLQFISNGRPILINSDQIVAIGSHQYDNGKTWIDCANGEEYMVDCPFEEVVKCIPSKWVK